MNKNQTISTNHYLTSYLAENDLLRTYAYFLKFKYLFSSSRLNNGNRAELSRLSGFSDKTVRMKVGEMRRLGWIKEDRGDFIFKSAYDICKLHNLAVSKRYWKTKMILADRDAIIDVIAKLASTLVEASLIRQQYIIGLNQGSRYSTNSTKDISAKDKEIIEKSKRFHDEIFSLGLTDTRKFILSELNSPMFTCGMFAKIIKGCLGTGFNLKRRMIKLGLITAEKTIYLTRRLQTQIKAREYLTRKRMSGWVNMFCVGTNVFERGCDKIKTNGLSCLLPNADMSNQRLIQRPRSQKTATNPFERVGSYYMFTA